MSALIVGVVVAALLAAEPAQEWSAEQQEVLDFAMGCQESREAWLQCFHPDYVAWGDVSLGVPFRKSDQVAIGGNWWDSTNRLFFHIKPEEISVRGDLTVMLSIYTATVHDGNTGEVVTRSTAWTDVCVKENGRWYWIADHGTLVSGS